MDIDEHTLVAEAAWAVAVPAATAAAAAAASVVNGHSFVLHHQTHPAVLRRSLVNDAEG